jgi:hypothetical protein
VSAGGCGSGQRAHASTAHVPPKLGERHLITAAGSVTRRGPGPAHSGHGEPAQAAFQYPASLTESTQPLRRGRATSRGKPMAEALGDARQIERARKILESAAFERVIYDPQRIIDLTSTECRASKAKPSQRRIRGVVQGPARRRRVSLAASLSNRADPGVGGSCGRWTARGAGRRVRHGRSGASASAARRASRRGRLLVGDD